MSGTNSIWTRMVCLVAVSMALLFGGCHTEDDESVPIQIRGEVRLPADSRFPDQGALEIALVNTVLADTPDAVVTRHALSNPEGALARFEFEVDGDLLEENTAYALSATYRDADDRVWFVTGSQHRIEPASGQAVVLDLIAVARESAAEPAPAPLEGPLTARYRCADAGVEATFESGKVTLNFDGEDEPLILPTAISASGARFAQDGNEFWSKGRQATLIRAGREQVACEEQSAPAEPAPSDSTSGDP